MVSEKPIKENSTVGKTIVKAKNIGSLTRFVLDAWDNAYNGTPGVFQKYFTPDFKMTGPETKMVSQEPDGSLRGKPSIQSYHDMNHGDAQAWGKVVSECVWSLEADNTVVRIMRWTSSKPRGSYAGLENIPKDRVVTINGVFIDKLRNGKIYDMFWAYDTMSFLVDIAGGDMKAAGKALGKMGEMMEAVKKAQAEGKTMPMP
ncbi:MAG: hypothetical protein A2Z77_00440 [Chloroflexi bacterium RBG_13_51_36]|nr:MAG: hypothetical protein A2Z77_00440 [Chloroflexi bacterium RBG_13_51_36]